MRSLSHRARLAAAAAAAMAALAAPPASRAELLIPASNPAFRYDGRIDFRSPDQPVLIWENSSVAIDFEGPAVALDFRDIVGQNFFNVAIDGDLRRIALQPGRAQRVALGPVSPGPHELVLYKRSEATAGHAAFAGIEVRPGGPVWPAPAPVYAHRFVFYGDSITAGACNEDGAADQWEDRSTHNAARSYAALAAAALHADLRNISISGIGIAEGWVPMRIGEVWDHLYPDAASPRADLASFHPDVVFVNFGENDCTFSAQHGEPFPSSFARRYVQLVASIRAAYPHAEIVLLRGGMSGGAKNPHLRSAWEAAVSQVEAADPRVAHFVFRHWTATHPRTADDEAMAEELTAWLRAQPWFGAA